MTEAEWLAATDPEPMLVALRLARKDSEQKLRLFGVACCRRVWSLLDDERSRRAVETAEQYADGRASLHQLAAARAEGKAAHTEAQAAARAGNASRCVPASGAAYRVARLDAVRGASDVTNSCPFAVSGVRRQAANPAHLGELSVQADILRDIFGNPFRGKPAIDPSWLAWNGGTVRRLAASAYEERVLPSGELDGARLAVLADALEEAGCHREVILGHLRQPGSVHVRGCWVLDLLLGKSRGEAKTEADWLVCPSPMPMLEALQADGKVSERKLRLFACACSRRIAHLGESVLLQTPGQTPRIIEVAERFADGLADAVELEAVRIEISQEDLWGRSNIRDAVGASAYAAAVPDVDGSWGASRATEKAVEAVVLQARGTCGPDTGEDAEQVCPVSPWEVGDLAQSVERYEQAALLRDLLGNPFRQKPRIDPSWLSWNGGTVVRLAAAAYEERVLPAGTLDVGQLAALAVALEEAGCTDPDLLGHLRGPGPHARGCWAVDLVLVRT
jgi:hypothetical protein